MAQVFIRQDIIMTLSVAIQMDPISDIDIDADSTFALAMEAQIRGHRLHYYMVHDMSLRGGRVIAWCRDLELRREQGQHAILGNPYELDLANVDVVLMRQDPPFDMSYITATHILEHIHPATLVVNDPVNVRNAPEKLFVTRFPDLVPPTVITSNLSEIRSFRAEYEDIIIKPLFGNGGAGVFRLRKTDENLSVIFEMFKSISREPLIIQKYLPEVRGGDKRVILVDGNAVGAINRIPPEGEVRSNMHVGGTPVKARLTKRDEEICRVIGPILSERGLLFVGIDVIGNYMTEINVTSPTGIQECSRFDGTNLAGKIWTSIEKRYDDTGVCR